MKKLNRQRKPRTAIHRHANRRLKDRGNICLIWNKDNSTGCSLKWSGKGDNLCNGNPFVCRKLFYKYLASVKKPDKKIIVLFEEEHYYD